ncbi:Protein oar [Myxococcus stipitatus]
MPFRWSIRLFIVARWARVSARALLIDALRLFAALCLLSGMTAHAGATLIGKVTRADSPWDAFVGVTVTVVRYPDIKREAVTDEHGEYRVEDLSPGRFLVALSHDATATSDSRDVHLEEGQTLRLDVRLEEGPWESYLPIWGYNQTTSPHHFKVNQDFFPDLKHQPLARDQGDTVRSVDSALPLATGTRVTHSGLSLHGASGLEAHYQLDGLSTVDPAFGTNALPLHSSFLESIDLSWSGTDAMSGGVTGARIAATTTPTVFRRFSGSAFMSWSPGFLAGARAPPGTGGTFPRTTSLGNLGDLGGTFAGPIIPKRLAVFLGAAPILSRSRVSAETSPFLDQRGVQAIAKLTLKSPSYPGSVNLSFITTPTE